MRTLNFSSKALLLLILLALCGTLKAASPDPVRGTKGMVVSASDLASQVGLLILKRGGNAVDAAVATGFALAVTYPPAGNLGGGGFMVIHLKNGKDIALDYREKAPIRASKNMYLDSLGNFDLAKSTEGFLSSAVPGSVAGLIYALEHYGTMKLEDVIQPAIDIATDGFPLSFRLSEAMASEFSQFQKYPSSSKVFIHNGEPLREGFVFKQPDLAKTLSLIKEKGKDGFYKGEIAELIEQQSRQMGGIITKEDLENYSVVEKEPVKGTYRGYNIVSMPPSSSGGIALIEALNILENYSFTKEDWNSSTYIHRMVEALRYVYADRSKHLGDEAFYPVPKEWLTSKEYAKTIFSKISGRAISSKDVLPGSEPMHESMQTTHYSVADQYGNAVSTTTTLNSSFGNKLVVEGAGFLLNNEMDDFSAKPGEPNQFGLIGSEANSIQPGKRMLSSMTPTIVLKDNKPFMVIGSPGGSTIITVVLQTIMNVLDFHMNIQEAIDAPRIHHQWLPDELYYEPFGVSKDTFENLKNMGYIFGGERTLGRAEGILIDQNNNTFYGATDPRGYGQAAGF
ncbi:MAG: gamma-glutamyltransferase [Ignavibacteria bacterium]|nr:gamma-glutamyltransferase [Ignavibacteria bacterium]MCU7512896.1 gamma-glutamyltransferase [Ignavibacteria bacterium]MCU7521426.1 gamma-glutamyltransferase [Ignavibacteria bacterium]MCU7526399.1 gamma-glutamyltransferase [Ignavibacteria bacterium]